MASSTRAASRGIEWLKRPAATADYRAPSAHQQVGALLALAGMALVVVTLIGNVVAASDLPDDPAGATDTLRWTFGLTTTGFAAAKLGIAVVLVGIIRRLWFRVDSVATALPHLKADPPRGEPPRNRYLDTPYGRAEVTDAPPRRLGIHTMAISMWLPALLMGVMGVVAGLILSFVAAGASDAVDQRQLAAWSQGTAFLGEAFVLSAISFLLGTILAGLREGGAEVQQRVGVKVHTLRMPTSAKAFIALMMLGLMAGIAQFVLYIVAAGVADQPQSFTAWSAWLGPFREVALGTILAGITLALYTISKVLGFQFTRIRQIIASGV